MSPEDAGHLSVTGREQNEPDSPRRSRLRGWLGWLLAGTIFVLLYLGATTAGRSLYNPESRIPFPPAYLLSEGLLGANRTIRAELDRLEALLSAEPNLELDLVGDVYKLDFPRTVLDRLLGKRKESADIFSATTPFGLELRFLALRDDGLPITFAVELPRRRSSPGFEGAFVGLPEATGSGRPSLGRLRANLEALIAEVDQASAENLSYTDVTIFGPFAANDDAILRRQFQSNVVLSHLVTTLEAARADVSLQAVEFLVADAPDEGLIRAIYRSDVQLAQKPLWEPLDTSSLAHELVHAYVRLVLTDPDLVLRSVTPYFEREHPRLLGDIVGDRYEDLSPVRQVEEALAFIVGSIASRDSKTIASARLLENQSLLSISEPIFTSDVDLLIDLELLPECMAPERAGFDGAQVTYLYYNGADEACSAPAPPPQRSR